MLSSSEAEAEACPKPRPVIANVFMSELENLLVPQLGDKMSLWLRYVDDTFTFLKEKEVENVKTILNNFHPKIKFTHEIESNSSISFLDVKVVRNPDNTFNTSVYRKQTDTNVYVHWNAHAPKSWKIGTLKGLFRRAFLVSSSDNLLENEIDHLRQVFIKINKYPKSVVENTLKIVKQKVSNERSASLGQGNATGNVVASSSDDDSTSTTHPHLILPFKGFKGQKIVNAFKKTLNNSLPESVVPRIIYKGKKLASFFLSKTKLMKTICQTMYMVIMYQIWIQVHIIMSDKLTYVMKHACTNK